MTTRVTIKNEVDSNPAQELVVIAHNSSHGEPLMQVLKPGAACEYWVSSASHITLVERQAS